MFYSKSTGGFYDQRLHIGTLPADAVEITTETHSALLAGESAGLIISADINGYPILVEPEPPSSAQIIQSMRTAIQAHMDNAAKEYGYDDLKAVVTYADEAAVPKFQDEGKGFREWRSLVWDHAYKAINEAQDGSRTTPEIDELLSELPVLKIQYSK